MGRIFEISKEIWDKFSEEEQEELNQLIKQAEEQGKGEIKYKEHTFIAKLKAETRKEFEEKKRETQKNKRLELKNQFLDLIKDKKIGDATELIVNWIKENDHIYTTKNDLKTEMWIYRDGIYVPQGKSEVKKIMRWLLGNWFNVYYYGQVINKLEPDTFIEEQEFFGQNQTAEQPVENGLLNIFTGELKSFTPKKIFFNKLPVKYDPEAKCPKIEKFLAEVLKDKEDVKVFYEMVGFSLLKDYRFETAFILVGDGRNGKDKSLELIRRLVGVENCCSVPLNSLSMDSFIISEFFGKMVNVAGEISNQDLKDTSAFKQLTGRSLVSAPRKFLNPVTFENYAKFIFACNELPMVYDNSKGFWARWVLLEYPFTFVSKKEYERTENKEKLKIKDSDIISKITTSEELSGFLNKCLEGLKRLIKNKGFSTTKGSAEIKEFWIRKSNSVMAFAMDRIEEDYDGHISKKEFRKKYTDYCKSHKVKPKSDYVINRTLGEMYGVSEERRDVFGRDKWERVWSGIKWKPEENKSNCQDLQGFQTSRESQDLSYRVKKGASPDSKQDSRQKSPNLDQFTDQEIKEAGYNSREELSENKQDPTKNPKNEQEENLK